MVNHHLLQNLKFTDIISMSHQKLKKNNMKVGLRLNDQCKEMKKTTSYHNLWLDMKHKIRLCICSSARPFSLQHRFLRKCFHVSLIFCMIMMDQFTQKVTEYFSQKNMS